jgi:ADP-heptose:LPS heptosyltransferase
MKILVIRRDNIGDLVCTTPLFSALRRHYPTARLVALVNSYNAPVLAGNPEVDEICAYRKAKHRARGESALAIWWQTWQLMRRLRSERFDLAIVATPGSQPAALKFARWVHARRILGYGLDPALPLAAANDGHETEAVMRLLRPLGIDEAPGPLRVFADAGRVAAMRRAVVPASDGPLIGLHISARKPSQRWPIERFAALARALHARDGSRFLLFWSPGADDHPQHPGDDDKARQLVALTAGLPLAACPTTRLEHLIAGLALCDRVICADGGAMHLAAGLGKPIVCLFGNSGSARWRPWGVPHELLQPESLDVADIDVDTLIAAYDRLLARLA